MNHSIAQKFTFTTLMKFVMPTIVMMVFMSLYTIVDGIFVSRLLGSNPLSAMNIVYPVFSIVIGIGVMLGSGGSAIIAKKLGENKQQEACENFTLINLIAVFIGLIFMIICLLYLEPLCKILGANDILMHDAKTYLRILLYFAPICMLQLLYQTFFVTASNPKLGLILTILGGITNMILDYTFMGIMGFGIEGAALATGIGQTIPVVVGLFFFINKKSALHYTKCRWDLSLLIESCTNGSSEMVSNLSASIVTFLFNIIMLNLLNENGVAAITIVLYAQFLFNALYMGFSMGVAPVFSYNYGANDTKQISHLFKICIRFIIVTSISIVTLSLLTSNLLIGIFTPKSDPTYAIAVHGFILFAFNFLFAGMNIFASSLFTAFSNGKVSAIISFLRTFVIIVICIIMLPEIIGVDGVWLSIPVAELITLFISVYYLVKYRNEYHLRK